MLELGGTVAGIALSFRDALAHEYPDARYRAGVIPRLVADYKGDCRGRALAALYLGILAVP